MAGEDDVDSGSWWRHPVVIGAVVAGVFSIAGVVVTQALADGDGAESVKGIEAVLGSRVSEFHERCPTTITFEGEISVSGGKGDIAYRIVHVDAVGGVEQKEPVQTVAFDGAGTAPVRHEWSPTIPEGPVFRTAAIEITSPVSLRSNDVTVTGLCDATLPPGPPTPPPDVEPPSG
jgi:hypothetical protein